MPADPPRPASPPPNKTEEELRRVSERYRMIVEQSPDAIWLAENGRLVLVNNACVALLGARSATELLGRELREFAPAWPVPTRRDHEGEPPRTELRVRRLDGVEREVELSTADVPDHGGVAIQAVMRDITARKRAAAELLRTQEALMQAQRIARLGYFSLDLETRRWTIPDFTLELVGAPAGQVLSLGDELTIIHPDDREAVRGHLAEVLAGRGAFDIEYRIVRPRDGQVRWLHALGHTRLDGQGRVTHLFASAQDVTERKRATRVLEQQREELQRLSAGLTQAREEERRHVARELHDELGQRLLALRLELARGLPGEPDAPHDGEARRAVLLAEVDEAMAATRRIAAALRPPMLDDLGLNAALDWLAQDWSGRCGIETELDCEPVDDWLSGAAATAVYRIVQEALTNVLRHARAARCRIDLHRAGGELLVAVEDDGIGIGPGDIDKRGSSGLMNIRERARDLGGTATIRNLAAGGCRLEVRLPLERIDSLPAALHDPRNLPENP
jgi:PAS domain S-box-containing protein